MADQIIGGPDEIISKADAARLATGRLIEPELDNELHSDDLSDLVSTVIPQTWKATLYTL
tara:strand:- start:3 stop:182 length:180 start_codon:yes stop_codon:yes gene_type:complete